VENHGDDLYALTDYKAENYRVVRIHIQDASADKWQTVVPEGKDVISEISMVGGKLFVTGLHDVVTQTRVYSLDGKQLGELQYPTLGSASGVYGLDDSENAFYTFESFIIPPAIYHYDVKTGKTEVFAKRKCRSRRSSTRSSRSSTRPRTARACLCLFPRKKE